MTTGTAPEWHALLERRPSFRDVLEPLGRIVDAWWSRAPDVAPLACSRERAVECWAQRHPLITLAAPPVSAESVEPGLQPALALLGRTEGTRAFVDAWNRADIGPEALLPRDGRLADADLPRRYHLSYNAVAFLAVAGLRPALTAYFSSCRSLVSDGLWDRDVCPCCGSPPAFADLLDDGRRHLCCHLCDARWTFARLMCPICGTRASGDFVRLVAEGPDEGYAIAACRACRGYVKEIDRRARWNAGPAIVEDWGTPHLDLIAHRQGYWRPIPTLIQLSMPEDGP